MANTEKGKGFKDRIKMMVQLVRPIRDEAYTNIPAKFLRVSDRKAKEFKRAPDGCTFVKVADICNKERLAWVIRKHYGFSSSDGDDNAYFNVLFWNRWNKNKKFNPKFRCKGKKCRYYRTSKCASFWMRHQKGWACKANPKIHGTWNIRARVTIFPAETGDWELDYSFRWHRDKDKMHYFWFWKSDKWKKKSEK